MQDPKTFHFDTIPREIQSKDNSSHVIPSVAYIPHNKYLPLLTSIQPKSRLSLGAPSAVGKPVQENPDIDKVTATVHKPRRLHYIPKFLLKQFIPQSSRAKGAWSRLRKTGHWEGSINRYSLSHPSKLPTREIAKSYYVKDLYVTQNSKNPSYELENKLGKLENTVSNIMSRLFDTLEKDEIPTIYKMTRGNLNLLHKFLYVMGYRKPSVANIYRQPDPDDPPGEARLEYRTQAPNDQWLQQLRYILDTPHWEIVEHGRKAKRKKAELDLKFPHRRWSELGKDLESLEEGYMEEADGCFLAIWRAAEGEEFIISNDSFGILEGKKSSWGPIHRFYVISPHVALVICSVGLDPSYNCDPEIKARCQNSVLQGAKHRRPKVTHAVEPPDIMSDEEFLEFESKSHTREDDTMEFEVSTLTVEETHTLNAVILETTADDGTITYCSEKALQQTLVSFKGNPNFRGQSRYETLGKMLGGGEEGEGDGSVFEPNLPPPEPEPQPQPQQDQFGDSESLPYLNQAISRDANAHHPEGPTSPEKVVEKHGYMVFEFLLLNLKSKQLLVGCFIIIIIIKAWMGTYTDPSCFGFT